MAHLQSSNLFSVKDRVVIVTGGGSGLGRTMALALATNGASKVFVLGRREDALKETAAANPSVIIPVPTDVSSKASLEAAYNTISAQTGHVDVLIANSGTLGPAANYPPANADGSPPTLAQIRDHLWAIPSEDFTHTFDVNVTGAYYTVLAFLPLLDAANKRRVVPKDGSMSPPLAQVIVTTSIAAWNRTVPAGINYNLSKAASTQMVKLLSSFFAKYRIRFNGIAPGLYYSDMSVSVYPENSKGVSDDSFPVGVIPATRGGSDEDIAGLVVWMASNSGGYLNGNVTVTDGGRLSVLPSSY